MQDSIDLIYRTARTVTGELAKRDALPAHVVLSMAEDDAALQATPRGRRALNVARLAAVIEVFQKFADRVEPRPDIFVRDDHGEIQPAATLIKAIQHRAPR